MGITFTVSGIPELKQLGNELKGFNIDSFELAKSGCDKAKQIAPHDTYALIKGISCFGDKAHAVVRSGLPNHKDKRERPYHLWFHGDTTAKAKNGDGGYDLRSGKHSPKSGVPNYMELVFIDIQKYIDNKIKELQNIK